MWSQENRGKRILGIWYLLLELYQWLEEPRPECRSPDWWTSHSGSAMSIFSRGPGRSSLVVDEHWNGVQETCLCHPLWDLGQFTSKPFEPWQPPLYSKGLTLTIKLSSLPQHQAECQPQHSCSINSCWMRFSWSEILGSSRLPPRCLPCSRCSISRNFHELIFMWFRKTVGCTLN